jgi:hypothetical protein
MEINPIFDDIELNKIDKNFILIDNKTKNKIYNDNSLPNNFCTNLLINLKSKKSSSLDVDDILPILRIILDDKQSIDYYHIDNYTNTKINYFKILYDRIIKNNNRNFILIKDPVEDFSLSWLMHLYH